MKKLHQIWVGNKKPPIKWLNTWKEKNPDFEYIFWDNEKFDSYNWKNRKQIDKYWQEGKFHGVADIMRYQILYDEGGVIMPADSECLKPINDLESVFTCYENELAYPGRLCPIMGANKGNELMKILMDNIPEKVVEPWIDTGNLYLTKIVRETKYPIRIYPSWYFIPLHYSGYNHDTKDAYSIQYFGTTKKLYD